MGAYNWIVIRDQCPVCGQESDIRCQTHIASSYDGDETGRFHDRNYRFGERMAWYFEGHKLFPQWRDGGDPGQPSDSAVEACYSNCQTCGADLYTVVRFENLTPTQVIELGPGREWPEGHSR